MAETIFNYKGVQTMIQCNIKDQLREINKKFLAKAEIEPDKIFFLYNGDRVNEELIFQELVKSSGKESNSITILVQDIENDIQKEYFIKSEEIICPKCFENIRISLKDYRINLYDFKGNHKMNDLLLTEFEKSQNLDIAKVVCGKCHENNKAESFNYSFYKCCTCDLFLCPLCRTSHDKQHKIINCEEKYYICDKYKDIYSKYCEECRQNICMLCEKQHKGHKTIYFGEIMADKDDIMSNMDEFKKNWMFLIIQ